MRARATAALIICALLAAADGRAAELTGVHQGITGGTLRGRVSNQVRRQVACEIAVPDSFIVLDVKFEAERVLVAAVVERGVPGRSIDFLAEFWHFSATDTNQTSIGFADRKVLLSNESTFGESMTRYTYSINCQEATAVYRAGWEWGSVLVFDASGEPIIPMRGTIERACGCVPEYTHPVAWITELRRPLLVLSISDGGMGPFYAVFDPASREARALEPGDTFSEVQSAILGGAMWQRLR